MGVSTSTLVVDPARPTSWSLAHVEELEQLWKDVVSMSFGLKREQVRYWLGFMRDLPCPAVCASVPPWPVLCSCIVLWQYVPQRRGWAVSTPSRRALRTCGAPSVSDPCTRRCVCLGGHT